jgi:putative MATE family efflux protein
VRLFSKKDLYRLIIPLILEQILGVTVGMADTVMVSGAGEAAVSGVSLVDTLNILVINIFSALATGGAVVAARYLGNKNEEKACRAANQLLLSITVLSSVVMIISLIGNRALLQLIYGKIDTEVMNHAVTYFYLTAISFPFLAIYSGSAALCRSMGNTKITMMTSVLVNVINVTGNAIFVFGLGMGAGGVGAATLISRIVGAIVMLCVVHNQKLPIHIDAKFRLGFHPVMIRKICNVGIPTGIDSCVFQVGKLLVQSLVAGYGTTAIAANAVANNISGFVIIPASSIGLAMITVIGQCVGAQAFDDAKYYIKKLMKMAHISMFILNIAFILLSKQIVGIYHLSPEASGMAWKILLSYSIIATILWPSSFALPNALRASDDAKYTMYVSIISMWVWRVALCYLLDYFFHLGLYGTWIAMYVDWICRATFFLIRIKRKKWGIVTT